MSCARLRVLFLALLSFPALVPLAYAADQDCDRIFRLEAESLDNLLDRAEDARQQGSLSAAAYAPIVDWLYVQEQQLYSDARAHHFDDLTEGTYWQRSRLKFPSSIDQEHDAIHLSH